MNSATGTLTIALIITSISCTQNEYGEKVIAQHLIFDSTKIIGVAFKKENSNECKKIYLGEKGICLPELKGMIECYNEPEIKTRVDQFKVKGNTIHGYYMNDSLYKIAKENTDYIVISDCYKVFSVNETHNISITPTQLKELFAETAKIYRKNIYNEALDEFDKKYKFITLDSPVVIEEYQPHNNIQTALMLIRSNVMGKESFSLMTLNLIIIKERLLFYSYYLMYNGNSSINFAKNKSDYYGLKIINEN